MGSGQVIESGTHTDLLSREGHYAKLVAAQKLRESDEKSTNDVDKDISVDSTRPLRTTTRNSGRSRSIDRDRYDLEAAQEVPLTRKDTPHSFASAILNRNRTSPSEQSTEYSLPYLFKRMGILNRGAFPLYVLGSLAAICTGANYPAFGIVFSRAVTAYQVTGAPSALSHRGHQNALYFFAIAISAGIFTSLQISLFTISSALLTSKLRYLSFRSILRQDGE